MKAPLLIVLGAVVLAAGSGLAIINKACKSSHHAMVRSSLRRPAPREDETQLTDRAPGASPPTSPSCRGCFTPRAALARLDFSGSVAI